MSNKMQNLENTTAVVLAGGLGTRLRPIVADRPKILATVNGRPFLTYILDQLAAAGIKEAVLCTGYMAKDVRDYFKNAYSSIQLHYSQESTPLGTGGAIRQALPYIKYNLALILNGDSYIDINLRLFWEWFHKNDATVGVALTSVANTGRYGAIQIKANDQIISFLEKDNARTSGLINAGIYILGKKSIENIPPNITYSLEKNLFPALTHKGFYGYRHTGEFIDIGTPSSYALAPIFFKNILQLQQKRAQQNV